MDPRFDAYVRDLGIALVPVDSGSKQPYHKDWPNRTFLPETDFKPEDKTGAKWGESSGGIVDVDIDCPEARRIFAHVVKRHGITTPTYGRRSNPDSHYLFLCPGVETKKFLSPFGADKDEKTKGNEDSERKRMLLEIRSTGSQSVLPGNIHHPSNEPYEWSQRGHPFRFDEPSKFVAFVERIAAASLVAKLLKKGNRHEFALPFAGFLARNGVTKENAHELIELVAVGAEDEELTGRRRDVETTYQRHEEGEELTTDFTTVVGSEENAKLLVSRLKLWLGLETHQVRLLTEQELLRREPAPFAVKDALVQGSLIALVSPPDLGKTFVSIDLAARLAAFGAKVTLSGERTATWLGHRILHGGPVVYIAAEGIGRFSLRLRVWRRMHGVSDDTRLPFYTIDQPVDLMDETFTSIRTLVKALRRRKLKPILVVVDTLSRCLIGGDENSAKDMGRAMAACDELRARLGCIVLVLHHTKKGDAMAERGSSVLRASVDTILILQDDPDQPGHLALICDRQKDADQFPNISIVRKACILRDQDGVAVCDGDGNPLSSCVIELEDASDAESGDEVSLDKTDKLKRAILKFVAGRREDPPTKTDIVTKVRGASSNKLWTLVKSLADSGALETVEIPQGKGKKPNVAYVVPDLLSRATEAPASRAPRM